MSEGIKEEIELTDDEYSFAKESNRVYLLLKNSNKQDDAYHQMRRELEEINEKLRITENFIDIDLDLNEQHECIFFWTELNGFTASIPIKLKDIGISLEMIRLQLSKSLLQQQEAAKNG